MPGWLYHYGIVIGRVSGMGTRKILKHGIAVLTAAILLPVFVQRTAAQPQPAAPPAYENIAPEAQTGRVEKSANQTSHYMAAAANPLAAQAGAQIMAEGGSAVDAAIATSLVLNLVEPQSSGIGGGGFMLVWDAAAKRLRAFDGRETAPAGVDRNLFYDAAGKKKPFLDAVVGGASVGVPGLLRMFELVHGEYGRLPWARLFDPAIRMAERGFPISPRLHALLAQDRRLRENAAARELFYQADGSPKPVGSLLVNQPLADTLRRVAREGTLAFYAGEIAADIVAAVRNASNPGAISMADLATYRAVERDPSCIAYRVYRVCTMPPPSSSIAMLQMLGMLAQFDLARLQPDGAEAIDIIAQASRLAYADRDFYIGDPDHVRLPLAGLLDKGYLRDRAALIRPGQISPQPAAAGEPPQKQGLIYGRDTAIELPSTSHVSIVDSQRNAVSMTVTIENVFGSRQMVRGFLLNNQLTDFSADAASNGQPVANRIEPGKRPRSSMAPVVAFNGDGSLRLVVGSPGGSRIIGYVMQTVIGVLDWQMDIQQAVAQPHFIDRNAGLELEADTPLATMADTMRQLGHKVSVGELGSGLQGIEVWPDKLVGGADPRREGVAIGR